MSANPEGDANKSIEKRILEKLGDEELEPKEVSTVAHISHQLTLFYANLQFENLILDGENIGNLSEEDKTFLQKFELKCLSLNATKLKSLDNFPKSDSLTKVSLLIHSIFKLPMHQNDTETSALDLE